jgi:hypothetical protein
MEHHQGELDLGLSLAPPDTMWQEAPRPEALAGLVNELEYKPGWTFFLGDTNRGQGSSGLTLVIGAQVPDSYDPGSSIRVVHYMVVPAAAYDERSWRHWLFEQILLVERHEAMEYFQIGGRRPYAPSHGPGNDCYMVREIGTLEDAETSSRGVRDTGSQA